LGVHIYDMYMRKNIYIRDGKKPSMRTTRDKNRAIVQRMSDK